RVAQDLLDQPGVVATQGQRRVMTVMFCDMKGFTTLSEGVTPQGLVKIMNRYLSIMSEPIRSHRGVIDKYIGDAIMAYWGAPFVEEADQAHFACLAAIDMLERVGALRQELPELLGVHALRLLNKNGTRQALIPYAVLLDVKDIPQVGPLQWRWISHRFGGA